VSYFGRGAFGTNIKDLMILALYCPAGHADFTFSRASSSPAENSRLIDWLQDMFEVLHTPQMHFLPEAK
jgi:hypothetical protein